jgi:hypothetical protein
MKRACRYRASLTGFRILALLTAVAFVGDARGQSKLESRYTISVGVLPIGDVTMAVHLGDDDYTISANGRTGGFIRLLASGRGSFATRGAIKEGRLVPASFMSKTTSGNEILDVMMLLVDSNVTELSVSPQGGDRVPLSETHLHGVLDPLTAMLIPAGATDDRLTPDMCQRTLSVFDGYQRYDLKLTFKRIDTAKAEQGYAGPVVVCTATHQAIAGHQTSDPLLKFLAGREIESTLAPIAGTRFLAPFRISVASTLANLVIQATRFQTSPQSSGAGNH